MEEAAGKKAMNGAPAGALSVNTRVLTKEEEEAYNTCDPEQRPLFQEMCIRIDHEDQVLGPIAKRDCHLNSAIREGILHRAFSVFLFSSKENGTKLLLQQRSDKKPTFPLHWTNTCCSHPVYFVDPKNTEGGEGIPQEDWELEEGRQLGVKRAAKRKLWHELGIAAHHVPDVERDFTFLTRIHYMSEKGSCDGVWGEHEIDYILFLQRDVEVVPRPNEVKEYRWVTQQELTEFMETAEENGVAITPWFKLIVEKFLFKWWDALLRDDLASQADVDTIHRLC
ncbi:isopentenyl-diphosphate delta-isomerase idi1 [Balamuthia mandrillaris]